jgi:hypothetical protein
MLIWGGFQTNNLAWLKPFCRMLSRRLNMLLSAYFENFLLLLLDFINEFAVRIDHLEKSLYSIKVSIKIIIADWIAISMRPAISD